MFIGVLPKSVLEQITRVVSFNEWRDVFVGCSGSFRFERAVKRRHWSVRLHSNDVSLLSCALGALATGATFDLVFKGRLRFVERKVRRGGFEARAAAVMVALEMAKYKADNPHAAAHFRHYRENFGHFLDGAKEKLARFLEGLAVDSFVAGDFTDQVARADHVGAMPRPCRAPGPGRGCRRRRAAAHSQARPRGVADPHPHNARCEGGTGRMDRFHPRHVDDGGGGVHRRRPGADRRQGDAPARRIRGDGRRRPALRAAHGAPADGDRLGPAHRRSDTCVRFAGFMADAVRADPARRRGLGARLRGRRHQRGDGPRRCGAHPPPGGRRRRRRRRGGGRLRRRGSVRSGGIADGTVRGHPGGPSVDFRDLLGEGQGPLGGAALSLHDGQRNRRAAGYGTHPRRGRTPPGRGRPRRRHAAPMSGARSGRRGSVGPEVGCQAL